MENQPKDDDKLNQLATKKGINLNEDDNNENMVTGKSVALKESLYKTLINCIQTMKKY